jgi:hypothetical protein
MLKLTTALLAALMVAGLAGTAFAEGNCGWGTHTASSAGTEVAQAPADDQSAPQSAGQSSASKPVASN